MNLRNYHKDNYEDGTKEFRIYFTLTMTDEENLSKKIANWKQIEHTLNKTESVEDEKTIFFPLDSESDVR